MKCFLPISVVIPILNCADRLPGHLKSAIEWLPFVQEIIVVDSYSDDESVQLCADMLADYAVTILQHPRGLYASWNYGVKNASADYIYFSTVGDTITYDGLARLYRAANELDCDVIVSPPKFTYESDDQDAKAEEWPIHRIIELLSINEPQLLDPTVVYKFVLVYLEQALLGSSASNLYRRKVLLQYPFSDEFYSAGDSAWLIEYNYHVRFGVMPSSVSTFLHHEKDWSYELCEQEIGQLLRRKFAYRAFKIALSHNDEIPEYLRGSLNHQIEEALGPNVDVRSALPKVEGFRQLIENGPVERLKQLEFYYDAFAVRVEYIKCRDIDRMYRTTLGPLRYLLPWVMKNRSRRKENKQQLIALANSVSLIA